jgi:CHAT domain-containing protein
LPRLQFSRDEVVAIAGLLKAPPGSLLIGTQASEAAVKRASEAGELARARFVHFATHGVLAGPGRRQPALVLAPGGGEDGFLELDEVTGLKLNADLVVLSACRSGQGRLDRAEGITGLARAFLYAGSRGVVCSLWQVDDRQTARLMAAMYRELNKGRPAADALRAAQRELIDRRVAPLYWAPFVLIGE